MEDSDLIKALRNVTGPNPTRSAVRLLVDRCYRIALDYLQHRQNTGAHHEDLFGEDIEDLAMDAIAELFERDEEGKFTEIDRYFSKDTNYDSPENVEEDLKRLVFSAVGDWLFEQYRTADRSLSNAIRAIKRVLKYREDVQLIYRGGTLWADFSSEIHESSEKDSYTSHHTGSANRLMPIEKLAAQLTGTVASNSSTGDLVDVAIDALREHPRYESAYPVTRLAQVMREARTRVQSNTEHEEPTSTSSNSPLLRTNEIVSLIKHTLSKFKEEKKSTYVETGKVDNDTYEAYFKALRDRFRARFVPPGDPKMTHYDALSRYLPELSREEYREIHRARFEYLDQAVRRALEERFREVVPK